MSTVYKRRRIKVDLQQAQAAAPAVEPVRPSPYFRRKGRFDRIVAALLLIPALPIIGVLVVLIRVTSRGAAIYRQPRVGKDGRRFVIYKLRSMIDRAEAQTGPVWSQASDPRVTLVGRFLRKFHLDELPQLFNVLKGEMSLVGPRPERPEFVRLLSEKIAGYANRLAVPPGVTGLAQLNLPPDSDLDSVRRKLALDVQYIERAGLFLDVRIVLCTALRMVKFPALRVFRLERTSPDLPGQPAGCAGGKGGNGSRITPKSSSTDERSKRR